MDHFMTFRSMRCRFFCYRIRLEKIGGMGLEACFIQLRRCFEIFWECRLMYNSSIQWLISHTRWLGNEVANVLARMKTSNCSFIEFV